MQHWIFVTSSMVCVHSTHDRHSLSWPMRARYGVSVSLTLLPLVPHICITLRWRHNGHEIDSNHQPHDCLLNCLFRRRSRKTSKLCITGLWAGNSSRTGEFPAQMASNVENISIWWRHHEWIWSALIPIMAYRLFGAKPFSKSVLVIMKWTTS